MFEALVNVTSNMDISDEIFESLKELASKKLFVGVPDSTKHDNKGDDITNAQLLYIHTHGIREPSMRHEMQHDLDSGVPYSKAHEMYIHEHGSPLWHSPPRPVLEPAIDDSKEIISEQMRKSISVFLDGENGTAELEKVGMLAQNVCRAWFTNPKNGWPQNSEDTIKKKGSDKPLIDTGELRKSITYVIKEE